MVASTAVIKVLRFIVTPKVPARITEVRFRPKFDLNLNVLVCYFLTTFLPTCLLGSLGVHDADWLCYALRGICSPEERQEHLDQECLRRVPRRHWFLRYWIWARVWRRHYQHYLRGLVQVWPLWHGHVGVCLLFLPVCFRGEFGNDRGWNGRRAMQDVGLCLLQFLLDLLRVPRHCALHLVVERLPL
jgi:hypothetical protein